MRNEAARGESPCKVAVMVPGHAQAWIRVADTRIGA
jgi:hypothetical protein